MTTLVERARATLRANDRGGYTVPTARLYPFQWNWDSAFVAMGWATFDGSRAWDEMEFLLRGQWEDGLIPQIVFHAPSQDYFPGPEVWGVKRTPPTSGITQPPVLATAARRVFEATGDSARMAAMYPRLVLNHRWWEAARDPRRTGLVATLHPWETGMDNSPAWDRALARVPLDTVTKIVRRDTSHVDPSMRPRGEEYQRFIHLVDVFRDAAWEPARMLAVSPFRVADVGTNAILLRAERDLLALAGKFGTADEAAEIQARVDRKTAALEGLWSASLGQYVSRDLIDGGLIEIATSAGLLPLHAGVVAPERAASLAAVVARWGDRARHPIPSTDPGDPRFEPMRYWRGPIWAVVNWMIAEGFVVAGHAALGRRIHAATRALIEGAGLSEYFDPVDGRGIGGADFSWTAAIYLMLTADPDRIAYKIMTVDEMGHLRRHGEFRGSAADLADGFIHMSTATQLPATIATHYHGRENLMLAAVDVASLGGALRWEPARGGQLFPHLHGALSADAVVAAGPLEQAADGSVKLPG